MNDKQLLEDCARTLGITFKWSEWQLPVRALDVDAGAWLSWNPLLDDRDSSRLEAELCMHVEWHPAIQCVTVGTAEIRFRECWGNDRQAARRRAGVKAAVLMKVKA